MGDRLLDSPDILCSLSSRRTSLHFQTLLCIASEVLPTHITMQSSGTLMPTVGPCIEVQGNHIVTPFTLYVKYLFIFSIFDWAVSIGLYTTLS